MDIGIWQSYREHPYKQGTMGMLVPLGKDIILI